MTSSHRLTSMPGMIWATLSQTCTPDHIGGANSFQAWAHCHNKARLRRLLGPAVHPSDVQQFTPGCCKPSHL